MQGASKSVFRISVLSFHLGEASSSKDAWNQALFVIKVIKERTMATSTQVEDSLICDQKIA